LQHGAKPARVENKPFLLHTNRTHVHAIHKSQELAWTIFLRFGVMYLVTAVGSLFFFVSRLAFVFVNVCVCVFVLFLFVCMLS
jgi:hypothetical protein